jgi:hypothetical protein
MKPTLIAPKNTVKFTLPIFVCHLEGTNDIVTHGDNLIEYFKAHKTNEDRELTHSDSHSEGRKTWV